MYKVLIVDDEFLSRYVLRTLISNKIEEIEIIKPFMEEMEMCISSNRD